MSATLMTLKHPVPIESNVFSETHSSAVSGRIGAAQHAPVTKASVIYGTVESRILLAHWQRKICTKLNVRASIYKWLCAYCNDKRTIRGCTN